jgi:hypothetical protein
MSEIFDATPGNIQYPQSAGKFVLYKTQSGRTLFAKKPVFNAEKARISPEGLMRETVRQAVTYAEFVWDEPIYRTKALGTSVSAYNLAVADYLGKPQILNIEIRGWTGGIGQPIQILAKDNFMVIGVRLVIRDREYVWEAGEARQSESNKLLWTYCTRTPVAREPGLRLDAYAFDLPGNVGEYHMELR